MDPLSAIGAGCDATRLLCRQLDIDWISAGDAEGRLAPVLLAANAQQSLIDRLGVPVADGGAWRRAGFQSEQVWFGYVVQQEPAAAGRRLRTARTLLEAGGEVLAAYIDGQRSPTQADYL